MRGLAVCCGSTVSRDITIGGCNSCIFQVNTRTRTVRLSRQVDVVGGRQRGIADFRAGHCRIQRKVARGDVGVFNLNTVPCIVMLFVAFSVVVPVVSVRLMAFPLVLSR